MNRMMLRRTLEAELFILAPTLAVELWTESPGFLIFLGLQTIVSIGSIYSEWDIRRHGGLVEGGNFAIHWIWLYPAFLLLGLAVFALVP